jgi:uncharacterized protein (DUF58 family)
MSRELSNPLQSLLAGAARSLPATTGDTGRFRARLEGAGRGVAILADVSSSMDERAGGRRKVEILAEALAGLWPDLAGARLIAFGSTAAEVPSPDELPPPSGGTALHLALDAAATSRPGKTVVISDGRPDSEPAALDAAGRLPGVIDVIYCGPDSDRRAIAFMYALARRGCGRVFIRDIARDPSLRLGSAVRALVGLPAPRGE